jgi:hypothetical protein
VYVKPFGREGEAMRVSMDGGIEPKWGSDGRELYFISANSTLTRVPIAAGDNLSIGHPVSLFVIPSAATMDFMELGLNHYEVANGGQRFLVREFVAGNDPAPVAVIISK